MTFTLHRLKNSTRVITVPHNETAAATVLVLYEVGSRYEPAHLSGTSHFIEHLMFKGTKRRPTTLDISRDLDAVGADYNAFTAKDYTGYYVKLQAERLELAVDILEDMIYHSQFRSADIEAERRVIAEELRMYEDNPLMLIEELVEEELYRGSSLARRIGGTVQTVAGLKRQDLMSYQRGYYQPSRTVIAIAGSFDEAKTLALLEQKFGRVKESRKPRGFKKYDPARTGHTAPRVRLQARETEQVQAALSFPTFGYNHPDVFALKVLAIILGGTMSSRLFTAVREREGLCYFIRADESLYQDVGDLTIQAGLTTERTERALQLIGHELKAMTKQLVTVEELSRAKEYYKGKTLLALEESSQQAMWYARQELLSRRMLTPEEKIARVSAVTREDIQRVAKQIFARNFLSLAIIGPFKEAVTQKFIRAVGL